jgi:hypothetical protein
MDTALRSESFLASCICLMVVHSERPMRESLTDISFCVRNKDRATPYGCKTAAPCSFKSHLYHLIISVPNEVCSMPELRSSSVMLHMV